MGKAVAKAAAKVPKRKKWQNLRKKWSNAKEIDVKF